jgi:hypothetical protein
MHHPIAVVYYCAGGMRLLVTIYVVNITVDRTALWRAGSLGAGAAIIMLGGVTVNFILAFIIYIRSFVYGDTYIANADMNGLLIENQSHVECGFQNR